MDTDQADKTDIPHKSVKTIACLGSGFVGGPTSVVIAVNTDIAVNVVDVDHLRIAAWNSETPPIFEPGLKKMVDRARGVSVKTEIVLPFPSYSTAPVTRPHRPLVQGEPRRSNLSFSTDAGKAIGEADLIFVCVNTPSRPRDDGEGFAPDLTFVERATKTIAEYAKSDKIVVEKSTVPCRTADFIGKILKANAKPGVRFDILSNPEFLAEGTAIPDLLHPDRVIIGSMQTPEGYRAAASLVEVYSHWVPAERIITMNLWSSELSKLAANAMLAQRVSSVNALSCICEATGADIEEVAHAVGLDARIGPHMLKASPGFGGSCFQKDIFNIVYLAESLRLDEVADYWRSIIRMNDYQKSRMPIRIKSCLSRPLTDKKVAVLGFAFKKNTSDTRESPAIPLVKNLALDGIRVSIYDPCVGQSQIWKELIPSETGDSLVEKYVEICNSAYTACKSADAVVIMTEWDEFRNKDSDCETSSPASFGPSPVSSTFSFRSELDQSMRDGNSTRKSSDLPWKPKTQLSKNHCSRERQFNSIKRIDWEQIAKAMRKPMHVFDGRNILDRDALRKLGFLVESIGRAPTAFDNSHNSD